MKFTRKTISLLLCAVMLCVAMFVAANAEVDANVTAKADVTEVEVGQKVTVTVDFSACTLSAINTGIKFDTSILTAESVTIRGIKHFDPIEDDDITVNPVAKSDKTTANATGVVSAVYSFNNAQDTELNKRNELFKITFVAEKAGTTEIVLYEESAGADQCRSDNVQTITITVKAACEHKDTTSNYNKIDNADKHTVTVTCNDCGEPVGEATEEACDTTGAKCVEWSCDKCKAEYDANTEHNYDNPEHKCACGDVEMFTLTIKDWHTESIVIEEFEVPFGANLLSCLKDVNIKDIVDEDGVYKFNGNFFNEEYDYISEDDTVPGNDFIVFAEFNYTGWFFTSGEFLDIYYEGYGYIIDSIIQTGWIEIDGAWYYFDADTCVRAEGKTRVPYPTVMIDGNTYAPNQEDIEYSASKDEVFIDKDEAWFLFDEEGKFQSSVTGIIDNRYVLNGQIVWHPGVVEYNGEYYYFRGDKENGNKLAEGDTWVTRNNTDADFVLGGCYNFVNGKLSGINGVVEGKYYENSKLMTSKGLVKLEGGYIYVRSNGEVVVNRDYWITKTNGYSIVNGVYTFDKDGYIVDPIDPTVYDGIVEINGVNYYYENGIKQCCKGVVEMTDENGDIFYIYVKSDGSLATGSYWPTNTNNYLKRGAYDWGTDGRYYPAD